SVRAVIGGEVCEVSEGMMNEVWAISERKVAGSIGWEGFLRHERALKHGLTNLPGRLLTSPALADDVSSPSSSYPSAGCSSAGPASVSLDKIRAFPVSVSLRVYRAGNGKRQFELIASGVPNDFP